mgnify:FL=1
MKSIKIKCLENGRTIVENVSMFDLENESVSLEVEYPKQYDEWEKIIEITAGDVATFKNNGDKLSKTILKQGTVKLQPTAILGNKVQKWTIANVIIYNSLNVLDDNEVIEESVAREIMGHTERFRQELGIGDGLTIQQIIDFIKGV